MSLSKLLKAHEETGEAVSLISLINNYLSDYSLNPAKYKSYTFTFPDTTDHWNDGKIHPSSIHGCPRYLVYKILKETGKKKIVPQLQRIFDNGTMVHHRIQSYLRNMGILSKKFGGREVPGLEVQLKKLDKAKEFNIAGSIDAMIKLAKRFVVEIKSMSPNQFYALTKPKLEHLWQGNTYMMTTEVPRCIFLYEAKDNQAMKEFIIKPDDNIVYDIQNKCKRCTEWAEAKVIPKRHKDIENAKVYGGKSYCRQCEMYDVCYNSNKYREVKDNANVKFVIG